MLLHALNVSPGFESLLLRYLVSTLDLEEEDEGPFWFGSPSSIETLTSDDLVTSADLWHGKHKKGLHLLASVSDLDLPLSNSFGATGRPWNE